MNLHCNILHLEDDDDDSLFFQLALKRLQFEGTYRRVSTVQQAMDYFSGATDYADRQLFPIPRVLVADSMRGAVTGPRVADLIAWLDQQPEFRPLVRVMLTGDMSETDQEKWCQCGISAVLLKGGAHEDMIQSVQDILRRCPSDVA